MISLNVYLYGQLPKQKAIAPSPPYLFATPYEREQYQKRLAENQNPEGLMTTVTAKIIDINWVEATD